MQVYQSTMSTHLDGTLPCDSDEIRQVQQTAIQEGMERFQAETVGVSAVSSERYMGELTVRNKRKKKRKTWCSSAQCKNNLCLNKTPTKA